MQCLINRITALAIIMAGTLSNSPTAASGLTLQEAERLALLADPGIQSLEANQLALDELSVAAGQLPDPMVKAGLMSLPTDTFRLGQEAMTQVQVGLVQRFPRGQTRALNARRISQRSQSLNESVRDQELQIILATREQYLEIQKQRRLAKINADAIRVLTELVDATQDYYATGRVHQEDVLQAEVELAKVVERASRISQAEDRARASLATWIGDAAYRTPEDGWPLMKDLPPADVITSKLAEHPRIRALGKEVAASETSVDIAREKYKPEFSVDVTYGGRAGSNPDGTSRSDLLSLMVMMDLPLFTSKRQDRVTAARLAQSSAVMFVRDDVYRRMKSDIGLNVATRYRQLERIDLFETTLLPQASYSAESSFDAYQSSFGDLTTLLRAQITEFELRLDHARLQAEALKTKARLLYLEGEHP